MTSLFKRFKDYVGGVRKDESGMEVIQVVVILAIAAMVGLGLQTLYETIVRPSVETHLEDTLEATEI
ncbi:MAG: hypothetical protein O3A00_05110 [Planctomycetota bacterium]|nr:hypothetical protein [Planctomycetota bacterium]